CLPETSHATILYRRAQRLRRLFGNPNIRARSELKNLDVKAIVWDALIKPTEIFLKDPAIAFACVYGSIVYAVYYSYFEAFPIVYAGFYGMSGGQVGLVFLSLIIGSVIAAVIYAAYLYYV